MQVEQIIGAKQIELNGHRAVSLNDHPPVPEGYKRMHTLQFNT
jgi:hypothetical protein